MKCVCDKRCIIGEGPIWNEKEQLLYFVNPFDEQICKLDIYSGKLYIIEGIRAAAIALDTDNRVIISEHKGIFSLNADGSCESLYDAKTHGRNPYLFGGKNNESNDNRYKTLCGT